MDSAEFDRFAEEYEHLHTHNIRVSGEGPAFFARYKVQDVAAAFRAQNREPRRILDFGGGVGNSLGFMVEAFPRSEIVLVDPSARSLEIASRRFPGRAQFQVLEGNTIPFADLSFDLVFVACVFHHIPAELHAFLLREIERVLTPGGSLFIFEHNPYNPLTVRVVKECPFDENATLIAAPELRRRVRAAGFQLERVAYRLFFPHFLRHLRGVERYLKNLPLGAQYYVHATKGS